MQFGKDMVLRLLIVDDSVEAAEAIVSGLRNTGIAVRPTRPESEAEFETQLAAGQQVDLMLIAPSAASVPFERVLQLVNSSGKDLPVVLLVDTVNDELLLQATESGVRGICLRGQMDQIQTVVRTEWADLDARRAQRRLEAQVRETERRCDALIESSRDPIAYIHEGMHIRANQAYLEMFGFESFEDIEGMSILDLLAPSHVDGFKKMLKLLGKSEAPPRYEVEARTLDGASFPAVMEFTAAQYEGETCQQVVLRRQELDPELAREVEELRQRDQATGLYNRSTFLRSLEDVVADAAQNATSHALLLLEPDHYQRLIQDFGLDAADQLIAAIADRLRSVLGPDDVAARFGEHQLAVLRRSSDHAGTTALAEAARAAFADHVLEMGERSLNATISMGGVQIGQKIASVSAVLAKASQGVQSASGVGGNRFEIFDPGAVDRAEEERIRAWVERIRDALDTDRFITVYQPLVSLTGQEGEMYNAYLRMQGEPGELVQPLTFLQIAEEHGLLWEIDRWVVGHAIGLIGERQRQGKRTTLLIKITEVSLQDDSLINHMREQLAKHGTDGSLLVLQLPESKVFTNLRAAQAFQQQASMLGVRVALEQFGAGLNSFQLLSHFDAAMLKIDRSFVADLSSNKEHQERVREIAEKARELGKQTIAEFVQDAGSMSILFGAGIDYAQGHFLGGVTSEMDYEF